MNWQKLLNPNRIRKSIITDTRNQFESDYGRIIYSPALRRMHDKTQVFPLTSNDNIHSRLTHSNEVMSIGYTFGMRLCSNVMIQDKIGKDETQLLRELPIILQNACLIHDIGNAPFGHFAEQLVADYFKEINDEAKCREFFNLKDEEKRDFLLYDGNAQGLRVLTKLQFLNDTYGLNLTYATLGTFIKYPCFENTNKEIIEKNKEDKKELDDCEKIETKKHGVFYSERAYFKLIKEECGLEIDGRVLRHPLCYLMEAADSIAYLCMDMEDGFNKGLYGMTQIKKQFEKIDGSEISDEIIKIIDNSYYDAKTKMVKIRIALIQYFVDLAYDNFIKNLDSIEQGNYNKELIEDDEKQIYETLQYFSKQIFKSREISYLETTGYSVYQGLLDYYIKFIFHKNKKYVNKAKSLISNSIINCAIEENLIDLCDTRLKDEISKINSEIERLEKCDGNKDYREGKIKNLKKDLKEVQKEEKEFEKLKKEYYRLTNKQRTEVLSEEEYEELLKNRKGIYDLKLIGPDFHYLSEYYKFRIIVDFISGMTDQFALNHFQKISGQKI